MEQTRFTANGKPVYVTKIGTLIFVHPTGEKQEVSGMAPITHLTDLVDVYDEQGHNIKYIRKYSVGWRGRPEDDHPCPCKVCQSKTAPSWWRESKVEYAV